MKHIFPEHPSENNPLDCLDQFYWPYGEDGQADTDRKFKRFVQLCAQYYTDIIQKKTVGRTSDWSSQPARKCLTV